MSRFDTTAAQTHFGELKTKAQTLADTKPFSVKVGTATCGISAGARSVLEAFQERIEQIGLDATVHQVGCLGHCYAEPMAILQRPGYPPMVYHHLNATIAKNLVDHFLAQDQDPHYEFLLGGLEEHDLIPPLEALPRFGREVRRILCRSGLHDPTSLTQAIQLGAYTGFVNALALAPNEIIRILRKSGLRGMGGAGFLVWLKWQACRQQTEKQRYLICNADEGDPGAFMDRTLLESDPHAIIEGMLIGGMTLECNQGFVYVRAEYPKAVQRLHQAVASARENGLLGTDILGSGYAFDIQIVEGAGAFVCGESSALMRSIEGRRGIPRVRPPQSTERGLYRKPTVLNNVKSLAAVSHILQHGASWFSQIGTAHSKSTAVFALAGKIANPGLVEVPMGTTLHELIFDIGGGIPAGKSFKAVQIGGPSGGCLPGSKLDTPIDFDALQEAGAMMGSGGMVILDEDNCMVETARYFLEFTQQESCGACTFCRIGTRHMLDILTDIVQGRGTLQDLDRLCELARDIQQGSLCNLGKTAPNPVLTTLRFFRSEYEAHIQDQTCWAKVCNHFYSYYIDPGKCARGCEACVGSCPPEAIYTTSKRVKAIDQNLCIKCDSCMSACPDEYSAVVRISPLRDIPQAPPRPTGGDK